MSYAGGLAATRTDDHHFRGVNIGLFRDNTALYAPARIRLLVVLDHSDAFNEHLALVALDIEHARLLALVSAGKDHDPVVFLNMVNLYASILITKRLQSHNSYITSG